MKFVFVLFIFSLSLAANIAAQSCGGGTATFLIFDSNGKVKIKNASVSLFVVSEDLSWRFNDMSALGWKVEFFHQKSPELYQRSYIYGEGLDNAYKIPSKEYSRLMDDRSKILAKDPKSIVSKKIEFCVSGRTQNVVQNDQLFSVCVVEGCEFMVAAKIEALGFETGYYVSDFTCGCVRHYEFRLNEKPKNLPSKKFNRK